MRWSASKPWHPPRNQQAILVRAGRTLGAPDQYLPRPCARGATIKSIHQVAAQPGSGRDIELGALEFRMLRFFMTHPGRVYSRAQLLDEIWGNNVYVEERTVDVHIRRLRQALNRNGGRDLLRTVRSVGYALDRRD